MKKTALMTAALLAMLSVVSCGDTSTMDSLISQQESATEADTPVYYNGELVSSTEGAAFPDTSDGDVDIDLTKLSSSMIYGQVYDMVYSSENYVGKKIRAKGNFSYYKDPDGKEYFAVLISDATACCSQGIEFVLTDENAVYPDDYPPLNTEITVEGDFNSYKENYSTYVQLLDAKIVQSAEE
ncbi:MAG: hypothetical protein IJ170_07990 [Ruminococcus sp.]|nr:hypothetical protein [Ruminococcus sp.]